MNHLAAFLLRLTVAAALARYRFPNFPPPREGVALGMILDAADGYDRQWFPMPVPAWLIWNAPGGEA